MARRSYRGRGNPSDSKRYYDWLQRAEDDMIAAELLMADPRCYLSSTFHCQQAIEKALKGYILLKSGELKDGHNLTWLCKYAMRFSHEFGRWMPQSVALSKCYIETRYPADIEVELTAEQVEAAFNTANDMFEFIFDEVEAYLAD